MKTALILIFILIPTLFFAQDKKEKRKRELAIAEKAAPIFGKMYCEYVLLQRDWTTKLESATSTEKLAFIRKNQEKFTNFGVEVETIPDAEKVLVKDDRLMIRKLKLEAKIKAINELTIEEYADIFLKEEMERISSEYGD